MARQNAIDYHGKDLDYFSVDRHDLLAITPNLPDGRILEIGAADGSTLSALKRMKMAREVVGVELMDVPASARNLQEIDRFIVADVEQKTLDFTPASFDVIICGDVLEHLRDPWDILIYLTSFLRRGGTFVISLPNILYWRAIIRILLGDFKYAQAGVLDRTHLRFFCKKNMLDLVNHAGLDLLTVQPSFQKQQKLAKDRRFNAMTFGVAERFFAQQYLITAIKK